MVRARGWFTRKGMFMARHNGFTLIELSLTLVMAMIMAGVLVPNFVRSLHIEAAKKAALEMSQIAEAARVYYVQNDAWPDGIEALKNGGFIDSAWAARNPFGPLYILAVNGPDLDVKTSVRQEVAEVVVAALPMAQAAGAAVRMTVTPPGASVLSVPTGTIMPWPSVDIPEGWLVCDGRAVSRMKEAALFSVIGVRYGSGNGMDTFNLPDLRGRVAVGMDDMGAGAAHVMTDPQARVLGGTFGTEKHKLTLEEMPRHNHTLSVYEWEGNGTAPVNSPWAGYMGEHPTSYVGADKAHNNVQPSMAFIWIIKG